MSGYDKACQVWLRVGVQLIVTSVRVVHVCSAGRLQAKFVIHTVGPVYESKEASAPLLRKAYTYVPWVKSASNAVHLVLMLPGLHTWILFVGAAAMQPVWINCSACSSLQALQPAVTLSWLLRCPAAVRI